MILDDLLPWAGLALAIGGSVVGAAVAHARSGSSLALGVKNLTAGFEKHAKKLESLDERADALELVNERREGREEGRKQALLESSSAGSTANGDKPRRRDRDETGEFKRR